MQNYRTIIIALLLTLAAGSGWAGWRQDGENLVVNSGTTNVLYTNVAVGGDDIYVSWQEDQGTNAHVFVKRWNGKSWASLGQVDAVKGGYPSLAISGSGEPYVSYIENGSTLTIKRHTGSAWQTRTSPSASGNNSCIGFLDNTLHLAWTQPVAPDDTQIFQKYWNGTSWVGGGTLNINPDKYAGTPWMTFQNTSPCIIWCEDWNIFVKKKATYNGMTLVYQLGNTLNANNALQFPQIAACGNSLYATYSENVSSAYHVFVKLYSGGEWSPLGGAVNYHTSGQAQMPALDFDAAGRPLVAWVESLPVDHTLFVKFWSGSGWKYYGQGVASDCNYPKIKVVANVPYIAYTKGNNQVFLNHWIDGLSTLFPNFKCADHTVKVTVAGVTPVTPVDVRLVRDGCQDIIASSIVNNNSYTKTVTFNLTGAVPGLYTVKLTNSEGFITTIRNGFAVLEAGPGQQIWVMEDIAKAGESSRTGAFSGLAIGDADNDGAQELYAASMDTRLYQLKKSGYSWSVAGLPQQLAGYNYACLTLADTDGDQKHEIYSGLLNKYIQRLMGDGWGVTSINTASQLGNGAMFYAVVKGDLDHDGVQEIYAAGDTGGTEKGIIYRFRNPNNTSHVIDHVTGYPNSQVYGLAVGDGNNDADAELYSANANGKVYQFERDQFDTWTATEMGGASDPMQGVAVGDGDNDGANEVYAIGYDGKVYQFRDAVSSWDMLEVGAVSQTPLYGIAVSDIDNNGTNEVCVAGQDGHVYALAKNATAWTMTDLGNAGTPIYALAVGDPDNDNRFEVYALGENRHVYRFSLASPTPTPTPTSTVTPTPPPAPVTYFKIFDNQINPNHNQQAVLRWAQPNDGPVTITVYNLQGDRIIRLADNQNFPAGQWNEIRWNGRNANGAAGGDGIYVVTFQSDGHKARGRIAVVK